ncbi:MAG: hypothetical protein ACJAVK_002491 [Akkermansiaceae bacterium]|jgi:hypothetical protein
MNQNPSFGTAVSGLFVTLMVCFTFSAGSAQGEEGKSIKVMSYNIH